MKVSTDSIVLGSWCAPDNAKRILDIGAGSGLLSLMLAQKSVSNADIIAIEPDAEAAHQAKTNVLQSPWPDKISVVNATFQEWGQGINQNKDKVDLIISNPPWFEYAPSPRHNADNQIRKSSRIHARQQYSLDLNSLFSMTSGLLQDTGYLWLILPTSSQKKVTDISRPVGLHCHQVMWLCSRPESESHASLYCFAKQPVDRASTAKLIVRENSGAYTPEFKHLCSDYYLNF